MKNIKKIQIKPGQFVWADKSLEIQQGCKVVEKLITGGYDMFQIDTLNDIDTENQIVIVAASPELNLEGVPTYVEWLAKQEYPKDIEQLKTIKDMNKEFIPYEQALALKELGFDERCIGYYHICNTQELKDVFECDYFFQQEHNTFNSGCLVIKAPLYQQAFRWFREKYGLFAAPSVISYEGGPYLWFFEINSTTLPFGTDLGVTDDFKTYEEAELACLNKLIEIIKNKQQS